MKRLLLLLLLSIPLCGCIHWPGVDTHETDSHPRDWSGEANLPVASPYNLGIVEPDETTISVSGGVLSVIGGGSAGQLTPWTADINAAGHSLTDATHITLGVNIPTLVDNLGLQKDSIKVNIPFGAGDMGKIGVAVIQPMPNLSEMYMENQDGAGNRLGSFTVGVNWYGDGFIGSGNLIRILDTSSPEPHTTLLLADKTNNTVTVSNFVANGTITGNGVGLSNLIGSSLIGAVAEASHSTNADSANVAAAVSGALTNDTSGSAAYATNAGSAGSALTAASAQNWDGLSAWLAQSNQFNGAFAGDGGGLTNLSGTLNLAGGYVIPASGPSSWPANPPQPGAAYVGNSNGVLYVILSAPGSSAWTKTNLWMTP